MQTKPQCKLLCAPWNHRAGRKEDKPWEGTTTELGQWFVSREEEEPIVGWRENLGGFWVADDVLFLDLGGSYNSII